MIGPRRVNRKKTDIPKKGAVGKHGKQREYAIVDRHPVNCPRCQSTERLRYEGRQIFAYAGEIAGKPFSHVVWRKCICVCGQAIKEKSHEYFPDGI